MTKVLRLRHLLKLFEEELGFAVGRVASELAEVLAQLPARLLLALRLLHDPGSVNGFC